MNDFKIFQLLKENFYDIVYILFVTEVLIYQARYQWNDIRGLPEDVKANKTDRLPVEIMGKLHAVVVSSIIIFARIGIAFGIVLYLGNNKKIPLLTCMILNLIITVFYEYFRSVKCHIGIFIVVALGYPLRLFTGIWYACPEFWKNNTIIGDEKMTVLVIILLIFSFVFYGELSVVLPWTHEAIGQKSATGDCYKSHYQFLVKTVEDRYESSLSKYKNENKFFPLRERGRLSDLWNISYLISLTFLFAVVCIKGVSPCFFIMETIFIVFSVAICLSSNKKIIYCLVISLALIVVKALLSFYYLDWLTFYIYICIHQIVFALTYFVLRYLFNPDFNLFKSLIEIFIGKETSDYLKSSV